MTIKEIQNIIKEFEASSLMQLELETKDVKIKLSKQKNKENNEEKIETSPSTKTNLSKKEDYKVEDIDQAYIKSPLVGTFYAAGTPDAKPYAQVGQKVKKGQVVCIIEAMKIMNEITSSVDGKVTKINFKNGDVVGFDDVLFAVVQA